MAAACAVPDADRSARHQLLFVGSAAALLVAQQVAAKATRDALFLVSFDPHRLPIVMATGAALSLVSVLAMARALAQQGPARVMPWALGVNATAFVIEWLAHPASRDGVAVALYLHVATLGSVLLSGLWSLVSELFDPHRARGSVPRIAAAATFGGVIGGVVAHTVGSSAGARTMLLVLAASSAIGALALARVSASQPAADPSDEDGAPQSVSSLRVMARTPFLRALAAMSLLAAAWEALLDFSFKAMADHELGDEASLVRFFALFYTATSLITFLFQALLGKALLAHLRVESSLRVLPLFVAAGGLALLFASPFWLVGALRGGESVLSNSVFRAAYELLFTPISRQTKRPTKTLVDVAATRVGDILGSVLVLLLVESWADMPAVVPIVVGAGVALLGLLLVDRIRASYVDALEAALRAGAVDLEAHAPLDATTRRTVRETTTALDRERLLAEVELLRRAANDRHSPESEAVAAAAASIAAQPAPQVEGEVPSVAPPPLDPEIVSRFGALASGSPERARAALCAPLVPELVPVAIPLLAHPTLGARAADALRHAAPLAIGTLVDRLIDPRTPFAVRFRIPRVLRTVRSPRAAAGLIAGLDDPRLEVRFQCARALVHLASYDSALAPAPERVLAAVERELAERGVTWSVVARHEPRAPEEDAHDPHEDDPISLDELIRMRASRSLQYVLTLLSMIVDGEALQLALAGLSSSEDKIRGTAIELLENVLPEPVRSSLVPLFETEGREDKQTRPREELMAELVRSQHSLPLIRLRPA